MPITSYELFMSSPNGNRLDVRYKFMFHTGEEIFINKTVPVGTDTDADMLAMIPKLEEKRARNEITEAVLSAENETLTYPYPFEHQAKADFLRRFFGTMMTIENLIHFNGSYPFFQAFEADPDSGNNKPQRAEYLGVDSATYDLIDKRYGDMAGIQVILNDEKGRLWYELPDGYW